jgi:hypothetical protein
MICDAALQGMLEFSTVDEEFNGSRDRRRRAGAADLAKDQQKRGFTAWKMNVDIGGGFAYKGCAALADKSREGEQYGQEIVEEGEEDRTNQAADQAVRTSFMERAHTMRAPGSRATRTAKGLQPRRPQPFFIPVWPPSTSPRPPSRTETSAN